MAPGARSKFGAPMFEREVFRKQMYCIEESACGIVGTFWRSHNHSAPQSDSVPVELRTPCPSRYAPADWTIYAACKKLQIYTLANNLPLCDKNALNVLD